MYDITNKRAHKCVTSLNKNENAQLGRALYQ